MSRKLLLVALSVVIAFQCIVLTGEYINAVYPLWTGQEVKLKTVPVDPRSLFRGNYARLRYEISNIKAEDINKLKTPRHGEIIYIKLKAEADGLYAYDGVSLNRPQNAVLIRGRVQTNRGMSRSGNYQVKYGIEAYFAPKEKAMALERKLRNKGLAKVMVAKNGKATLKEILSE
jgi:uncharacterized membrane-anchored protein